MRKSEIFSKIINAVSDETEITKEEILSRSKKVEIVDARSIAVILLKEHGFYPESIAKLMNKTSACIRHIISSFDEREESCKMIGIYLQKVRKLMEN